MAYRIVMIENEAKVSLKLNNIVIDKGDGELWIPLDDISVIVLDNLNTIMTGRIMSIIAEYNIALLISNQEHLPIGFYSSFDNHSRISKTIGFQIGKDEQFYDELWKDIIRAKIQNQRKTLIQLDKSLDSSNRLNEYCDELMPGDSTNREAHAAKVYFNTLMGETFSRGNDDILLNSGLNYIYAVVRAFIARSCVAYGLITQLGIHHKNEYNRFNLVDDLIEPIRPIADLYAYRLLYNESYFLPEHRHNLVNFLNHKIIYCSKNMYICNMIEEYVEQYSSFIMGRRDNIVFPDVGYYIGEKVSEI